MYQKKPSLDHNLLFSNCYLLFTNMKFMLYVLFSSHFGNLVFVCFLAMKLQKYYVIVCLFFILSCPSCLANGKHCTENQVTKKPKTMLPKYVMSQAFVTTFSLNAELTAILSTNPVSTSAVHFSNEGKLMHRKLKNGDRRSTEQ